MDVGERGVHDGGQEGKGNGYAEEIARNTPRRIHHLSHRLLSGPFTFISSPRDRLGNYFVAIFGPFPTFDFALPPFSIEKGISVPSNLLRGFPLCTVWSTWLYKR